MNAFDFSLSLDEVCDPTLFLGEYSSIWRGSPGGDGLIGDEDRDIREDHFRVLDFGQLVLEDVFLAKEGSIHGEENLRRLKARGSILLGAKSFSTLWKDYKKKGSESILEMLRKKKGIVRMYFFGTRFRCPPGSRRILYLYVQQDTWHYSDDNLGNMWRASRPSASLVVAS